MRLDSNQILSHNDSFSAKHRESFQFLKRELTDKGVDVETLIAQIQQFQVAIPSWALGAGGTRFGRFSIGGEPGDLYQKIEDISLINDLTAAAGAVSLHIPWDIPDNVSKLSRWANECGITFDAVNSNTFQDQTEQSLSYKYGSLCHSSSAVREQAIKHNIEVINYGKSLGSKSITIWLSDGSTFPGQLNFRQALERTKESLQEIYKHLPTDWKMFIEYKPYEPQFYSTVIQDWGTSHLLAASCGDKAFSLVDLGHHLPNTNIEQIVATLLSLGKLGGFHFNDSKYGDDDLTVGSIKPYQLFLIFLELVSGTSDPSVTNPPISYMIDASHNVKDPLEDLIQSLEAIQLSYAQALTLDFVKLNELREQNDVTLAQELLQDAYRTDCRPLLREARMRSHAAYSPIGFYRDNRLREKLIQERGFSNRAKGL
jgi:L-rhamnose isomerase / sugar isomerase